MTVSEVETWVDEHRGEVWSKAHPSKGYKIQYRVVGVMMHFYKATIKLERVDAHAKTSPPGSQTSLAPFVLLREFSRD